MVEKYSDNGLTQNLVESTLASDGKKKGSPIHALLLVGILAGWTGSICLYAFGSAGPLKASALIIISAMWMIAFFSAGSATLRK